MAKQNKQTISAVTNTLLTSTEQNKLIRIATDSACYVGHGVASAATGFPLTASSVFITRVSGEGVYIYSTLGCVINWITLDDFIT